MLALRRTNTDPRTMPSMTFRLPIATLAVLFASLPGVAARTDETVAFFESGAIPEIKLVLDDAAQQALRDKPREYAKASVLVDGTSTFKTVGVKLPVIVRLEGTNADIARKKLADGGLAIIAAQDLTDAAVKAVKLARGGRA